MADKPVTKRDIEQELLADLGSIRAHKSGQSKLVTRTMAEVPPPADIRKRLELSQQEFASMLGVSVRTVQEWEHNRRSPSGPAHAPLRIADQEPEVCMRLR